MDKKNSTDQLQSTMGEWFGKLPPLPASAIEAIFKIMPVLALIFGILGVLLSVAGLGALSILAPFAVVGGVAPHYGLGIIATFGWLVSSVMMLMAYSGLKSGKMGGWNLLFWSEVVNAVTAIIGISIGSVVGAAIAFYLLFQLKPKYK
jgi:hypothetical protein